MASYQKKCSEKSPCYECTGAKRTGTCHSTCEQYKEYEKKKKRSTRLHKGSVDFFLKKLETYERVQEERRFL